MEKILKVLTGAFVAIVSGALVDELLLKGSNIEGLGKFVAFIGGAMYAGHVGSRG